MYQKGSKYTTISYCTPLSPIWEKGDWLTYSLIHWLYALHLQFQQINWGNQKNKSIVLQSSFPVSYISRDHYPYYKANDERWKNSVRHNLSINPHFRKGARASQGAGHLWSLAANAIDLLPLRNQAYDKTEEVLEAHIIDCPKVSQDITPSLFSLYSM